MIQILCHHNGRLSIYRRLLTPPEAAQKLRRWRSIAASLEGSLQFEAVYIPPTKH